MSTKGKKMDYLRNVVVILAVLGIVIGVLGFYPTIIGSRLLGQGNYKEAAEKLQQAVACTHIGVGLYAVAALIDKYIL